MCGWGLPVSAEMPTPKGWLTDDPIDRLAVGDVLPEGGVTWDYRSLSSSEGELRLNLRFVGSYLRMFFIDEKGKIVAPPVERGWVWTSENLALAKSNKREVYLVPAPSGTCLTSGEGRRPVKPRLWMRPYFLGWTISLDEDGTERLQTCQDQYTLQLYDWGEPSVGR